MTNNISEAAQIKIVQLIAKELGVGPHQVAAAVALLDEGSTVPFIARYRKEATGNLDDTHLRNLDERLLYLRELEERRAAILAALEEQGKLTAELRRDIEAAATKQTLEDIYLPYKPKRRTRAQIAREAGLEPLADALFAVPTLDPEQEAAKYVNVTPATESSNAINVPDAQAALDGAREILCERFAETAELLAKLRARMWEQGIVTSTVMKGKETAEEEKFRDYYAYSEAIRTIPSHRALALFRGQSLDVLKIELGLSEEIEAAVPHPCVAMIAAHFGIEARGRRADKWLAEVCQWTWRGKAHSHISTELLTQLREAAEAEAIKIFGRNLHELLLAAPAGPKAVLGIDPGIRTGCKVAVVDVTGKLLEATTIYPHEPRNDWQGSLATLARMAVQHGVELISIGNGTASRETDKLAAEVIKLIASKMPERKLNKFGVPTVRDILTELEKPGRDPRPEFKMATFQDGIESLAGLQPNMILEGVVTNVAAFGAFVDIGVHQDGLVHVSALASKFVKDPHEIVRPGQIVKVKVMDVDVKRQRISLTMRLDDTPGTSSRSGGAATDSRDPRPSEPKRG